MHRPVGDAARPLGLAARENFLAQAQLVVARHVAIIQLGQIAHDFSDKRAELAFFGPPLKRALMFNAVGAVLGAKKIDGRAMADKVGGAFVECALRL